MAGQGSARVTLKEIDLSQVNNPQQQPLGVPAAVVGPARKGPAFVPRTFANIQQFSDTFGDMLEVSKDSNSNLFGPLALDQWLKTANAGTFIRTLGIGDGTRNANGAGFVVGSKQINKDSNKVNDNDQAAAGSTELGRSMVLGCFMKDEANSRLLQDAGIQTDNASGSLTVTLTSAPNNGDVLKIIGIDAAGVTKTFAITFNTGAANGANTFGNGTIDLGIQDLDGPGAATALFTAINDQAEDPKNFFAATNPAPGVVRIQQAGSGSASNTAARFNITDSASLTNGTNTQSNSESSQSVDTTLSNAQAASAVITVSNKPRVVQPAKTTITVTGVPQNNETFVITDGTVSQTFKFILVQNAVTTLNGNIIEIGLGDGGGGTVNDVNEIADRIWNSIESARNGGVVSPIENKVALSVDPDQAADNFTIETVEDVNVDIVQGSDSTTVATNISESQTQEGDDAADSFKVTDILGKEITFTFTENGDNFTDTGALAYDINIQTQAQKVFDLANNDHHVIATRIHDAIVHAKTNKNLEITSADGGDGTLTITNDLAGNDAEIFSEVRDTNNSLAAAHSVGSDGTPSQVTLTFSGLPSISADDRNEFTLDTHNPVGNVSQSKTYKFVGDADGGLNGVADVDDGDKIQIEVPSNGSLDVLIANIRSVIEQTESAFYRYTIDFNANSLTIINEKTEGYVQDKSFAFKLNSNVSVQGKGAAVTGNFGFKDISFAGGGGGASPIIRGLLMLPQGVRASLNPQRAGGAGGNYNQLTDLTADEVTLRSIVINDKNFNNDDPAGASLAGYQIGDVNGQGFDILLNGFKNTSEPAVLSCSFDPTAANYFANVLNTDPTKIEEKGHYLYANWDIEPDCAIPSNLGLLSAGLGSLASTNDRRMIGFLTQSSGNRNANAGANYEGFDVRYQTAKTPWFVSQYFSKPASNSRQSSNLGLVLSTGEAKKLFRLHVLDDGAVGNSQLRVLISGIRAGREGTYGSFDMFLELFDGDSIEGTVVAGWKNLNFDPESMNYIERVIGNQHTYYDFDNEDSRQRLVYSGNFEVRNRYVRVEVSDDVLSGSCPISALPAGFRGPSYIKSAGNFDEFGDNGAGRNKVLADGSLSNIQIAPLPFVKTISRKLKTTSHRWEVDTSLPWGIKFASRGRGDLRYEENSELTHNNSLSSWTKFYPASISESDSGDADAFQNNFFSLEKIAVKRASTDGSDNSIDWNLCKYSRDGSLPVDNMSLNSFVDFEKDANNLNSKYLKFRCLFQGGFDGLNIFDSDKFNQNNTAAYREANGENNDNAVTGPTIMAYRKALDVLTDKSAVELQLLAIPGIREPQVTNYAIKACEDRFDAMFVMDIEQIDEEGETILYDSIKPHVRKTIASFEKRVLDTSFAAAYFPNVLVRRPSTGAPIEVPPSVCMLGVMARNDSIADPWFAPAGLNRGRLNAINSNLQMNRDLLDELYDVDINPIYEPSGRSGEVYAFGQKTLLQDQSALDRINVRRLLIDLRRKVKNVAQTLLFEPNRASTLQRFNSLVEPILANVQARQGVERYKVQIDSNTTTQNDIENNTIRGKIYLQPTKSVEFISLDFVVTNSIN